MANNRVTIRDLTKPALAAIQRATARALNRAGDGMRVELQRQLARETGVSQAAVRSRLRVEPATAAKLEVTVAVSAKPLPLLAFQARQTKAGVTTSGRGTRTLLRHAFIARMRSGHRGVFLRRGKPRLPIVERVGAPLSAIATRQRFLESALAKGEQVFQARLRHELGRTG